MDYCGDVSRSLGNGKSVKFQENYICDTCGSQQSVSCGTDPLDVRSFNSLERELVDRWAEEGDIGSFRALLDIKKRDALEKI